MLWSSRNRNIIITLTPKISSWQPSSLPSSLCPLTPSLTESSFFPFLVGDCCRGGKGCFRVPADGSWDPVQCSSCCSAPLSPCTALPYHRETCCFHLALASGCHEPGLSSYPQLSSCEQPPYRHHKAPRKSKRQEGLTHALKEMVPTLLLLSKEREGLATIRFWPGGRRESSTGLQYKVDCTRKKPLLVLERKKIWSARSRLAKCVSRDLREVGCLPSPPQSQVHLDTLQPGSHHGVWSILPHHLGRKDRPSPMSLHVPHPQTKQPGRWEWEHDNPWGNGNAGQDAGCCHPGGPARRERSLWCPGYGISVTTHIHSHNQGI